jgi:uroporphyrinogen-III synthase
MDMSGFAGLQVLALESRRAAELSKLISTYQGLPIIAPAMKEVPLESNSEALAFAARLIAGDFDIVIFLTGVGARAVLAVVETAYQRDDYVAALQRIKVVARGPKPIAALREIGVTPSLSVPEPNTWRKLLGALDDSLQSAAGIRLKGARVAVQEYGVSNPELLDGLEKRGAAVTRVPVYQWALPDDLGPLRAAIHSLAEGKVDVVLFTTSVQAVHLFQVAVAMDLERVMRAGLERAMVASIGPTTSEELSRLRIRVDLEPSHPKMGFLVKEAAERAAEFVRERPEENASA